jgi:hypothetical protein
MLKKSSQVGFGADFSTYQFLATLISVPLTLAFHVLKFSLNNLSWSKYKNMELISWRRACKKMALVGIHFAHQF